MAKRKKKSEGVITDSNIEVKIEEKENPKKTAENIFKFIFLVAVIVILFYIFTATKEVQSVEMENHTITKQYTEEVPYTIIEEYEETVPYGSPRCGNTKMNFSVTSPWTDIVSDNTISCSFNLTNLENKEGTWEYLAYLQTDKGVTGNQYEKITVDANSTETFNFLFELKNSVTRANCHISGESFPSMEKCYFPEETFYKRVTRTREVTKYKNITKEKEIAVLNETTVIKNVNKFFGYEMPDFGW